MRTFKTLLTGLLLAVTTAGCAAVPSPDAPPLEGTSWVLTELPGRTLRGDPPATLRFEGGKAGGHDGCNRYTLGFTTRGSTIDLSGPGAATQMACPPEVMQQAQAYLAALNGAKSYRVVDGRLQILGGDGQPLATFAPQSTELAGTSWRATGINNGKGAVASLVKDTTVTLAFGADGRASGSAGCNNFTAAYEWGAPQLTFKAAATTRKMCADAGVMEQEQAFLKALESAAIARIEGHRLELRRADGALAASFVREQAQ